MKHTLTTNNIPIIPLKGWKYGLHSPFKADVYYVNTRLFTSNKWEARPALDGGNDAQAFTVAQSHDELAGR